MLFTLAPLFIVVGLATHPLRWKQHAHAWPASATRATLGPTIAQERALRRRLVRLARIKMFERREAMLFEFLAKAHAEATLFEDRSATDLGAGVVVGPTAVTSDFLGYPIVRARVRNDSSLRVTPLLTVHLSGPDGEATASIDVGLLEPGTSREIELASPTKTAPTSLRWTMMSL